MNDQEEKRNPKVDAFLRRAKKWQEEFEKLRMIVLDCELTEELKWGCPCYTFQEKKHSFNTWIQRLLCLSIF